MHCVSRISLSLCSKVHSGYGLHTEYDILYIIDLRSPHFEPRCSCKNTIIANLSVRAVFINDLTSAVKDSTEIYSVVSIFSNICFYSLFFDQCLNILAVSSGALSSS